MSNTQTYHGWVIELITFSGGYSFLCSFPEKNMIFSDGIIYSTPQQAMRSAWLRADLEAVKLSLTGFLYAKRGLLCLSNKELIALENSINQVVDSACNG